MRGSHAFGFHRDLLICIVLFILFKQKFPSDLNSHHSNVKASHPQLYFLTCMSSMISGLQKRRCTFTSALKHH